MKKNLLVGLFLGCALGGCANGLLKVNAPRYVLAYPDHWKLKHVAFGDGDPTTLLVRADPTVDYHEILYWMLIGKEGEEDEYEKLDPAMDSALAVINGSEDLLQDDSVEKGMSLRYALMQVDDLADVEVQIFTWPAPANLGSKDPGEAVLERLSGRADLDIGRHKKLSSHSRDCGMTVPGVSFLGSVANPIEEEAVPAWRTTIVGSVYGGNLVGIVSRVPYVSDNGLYCLNLAHMRVELQNIAGWIAMKASSTKSDGPRLAFLRFAKAPY